jgi:membrane-bound ClpP family serine protease
MLMKKLKAVFAFTLALIVLLAGVCISDTFTNRQTGKKLYGYAAGQIEGAEINVRTQEKGTVKLNPNEWEITRDRAGRTNKVMIIPVEGPILYEIETSAFEEAIKADANEGPLLILVEIDTPGGRVDLAQQMCAAITKTGNCDVIAFVKGGQYGGAISAGAAVALACKKIYMANNTVIGAATLVVDSKSMTKDEDKDKKKSYTEVVNEKMSSVWRAYLASLAQQNNRPGLLARAMVDSSIEVVEVNEASKRLFIEPVNKKPDQQIVHHWNKAGSLVTLTAEEAVNCTIADGLVSSRQELLNNLQASDANIVIDKKIANAKRELDIVMRRVDRIRESLDLKIKQFQYAKTAPKAMGILNGARQDFEDLKGLAKKYPDLHIDVEAIEDELNSIKAANEDIAAERKSRK